MSKERQRTGEEVLEYIRHLQKAPLKAERKQKLKLLPFQLAIALGFWGGGAAIFYWATDSKAGQLVMLLFISAGFWVWQPLQGQRNSAFFYMLLHSIMLGVAFVMWGQQ